MPDFISIVEHEALPIVSKRTPESQGITPAEAKKLASMKSLPPGAFTWQHRSLKWSQFCGVVRIDDLTLEVLPKIHGKERDLGSSRAALVRMLKVAGVMKLHKVGAASMRVQNHTLLDVFIQDLCEQIEKELLQGKIRRYTAREENLPVLRGKLLSGYQLRHNLAHKERLYCQFDELSADIPVNQVIKCALRVLVPLARRRLIKNMVRRVLFAFDGISDIGLDQACSSSVQFSRADERYEPIYLTCHSLIQSLYQDVSTGTENSFSLLFDMNKLFENWIASKLRPIAYDSDLVLREQGPRRFLAYRHDIDQEVFQLRPDISLLDQEKRVVLIADAKWKILDKSESKLGVAQSDLYQMQAYADRYGVSQLVLIYPSQSGLKRAYELDYLGEGKAHLTIFAVDVAKPESAIGNFKSLLDRLGSAQRIVNRKSSSSLLYIKTVDGDCIGKCVFLSTSL